MPGAEDDALEGIESREALNAAPDRERRILLLQFFAGMTQSQIAVEVGNYHMHVSRLLSRTWSGCAKPCLSTRSDEQVGLRGGNDAPRESALLPLSAPNPVGHDCLARIALTEPYVDLINAHHGAGNQSDGSPD
jgi:Sigma-70, region 4